jgi:hypothetical protein
MTATKNNLADVFTKDLPAPQHARLRAMLMGHATSAVLFLTYAK